MSKPRKTPPSGHTEPDQKHDSRYDDHPPPEDEYGGGDMCSPEVAPPTDDDKPLE